MSDSDILLKLGIDKSDFDRGISGAIKNVGNFVGAFVAIGGAAEGFKFMVNEAIEGEKATAKLAAALANARNVGDGTLQKMKDLSSAVQSYSGFADDAVEGGLSKLVQITRDADAAFSALGPTVEFARASGLDLEQAAQLVGRAYVEGTNVLKRYGIAVDGNVKGMAALEAIQSRLGGSSAAYMGTTAGKMEAVKRAGEELAETLGKNLLPIIGDSFRYFKTSVEWLTQIAEKYHLINTSARESAITEEIQQTNKEAEKQYKIFQNIGNAEDARYRAAYVYYGELREKVAKLREELAKLKEETDGAANSPAPLQAEGSSGQEKLNVDLSQALNNAGLQTSNFTRDEIIKFNSLWETKTQIQKDAIQAGAIMQNNANRYLIDSDAEAYAARASMAASFGNVYLSGIGSLFGQAAALAAEGGQSQFETQKALQKAQIIVETPATAFSLFAKYSQTYPPPAGEILGGIAAGLAVAQGALRLGEVDRATYNPAGASNGFIAGETMVSTFQPEEIVIPKRFSEGIQSGKYSLTTSNVTNNNNSSRPIIINYNGLDNIDDTIRTKFIPAVDRYEAARGRG